MYVSGNRELLTSIFLWPYSNQGLVSQRPVQPSCRRHEVPGWKTDCAHQWTVLYIYVQAYYRGKGRIAVHVNNKRVTLVHYPWPGKSDTGTALTAGVFNLRSCDVLLLWNTTAQFTWIAITPTLARVWFKSLIKESRDNCTIPREWRDNTYVKSKLWALVAAVAVQQSK